MKKFWFLSALMAAIIWSCSSDGGETDGGMEDDVAPVVFDRALLLANWADNIIIPSYQNFVADFSTLETNFGNFSTEPTAENLSAVRTAWETAYRSWQRISMFEIGPAETDGLRLNVNTYPADTIIINNQIVSGTYNFDLPATRDTKGFPALDYLFNGREDNLAVFTDAGTGGSNLAYTNDVIADIGTRVRAVLATWESSFRDSFVASDGSSATASVDLFANDFVFYYERFLRAGKMGIPAGVFTGEVAPNTIEARYQEGLSNALFLEGLDAVQDFFNGGANGVGFDDYLRTITSGNELVERINSQFSAARTAVASLDSFSSEIENNDPPIVMIMAYDEVQRLVPLLKTDMFSLLSIDVDFVDADGD